MPTLGGVDLSGLLDAVKQGTSELLGGFKPKTENPALSGLGGSGQGPDLWANLHYGGSDPLLGYQAGPTQPFAPMSQGVDLWASLQYGALGGGLNWGGVPEGPDLFGNWREAKGRAEASRQQAQAQAAAAAGLGGGTGGSYDNERDKFEQYRPWIQQYAAQYGIDPDALAAILWIETDGNPADVSHAGAQGLGQFMPGTWAGYGQGGDPFNPEHAIRAAANYFSTLYKQFGRYDLAAAAYQGGPGAIVNGQARNDINDGNLTPLGYSQAWQTNYDRIKQSAQQRQQAPVSAQGAAFPVMGYTGQVQLHWGEDAGAADLFAAAGTPVAAMRGGRVVSAGWSDIGGWNVTIQGDDGLTYYYAHLQYQPTVQAGQTVAAGNVFGAVGDTGNAKGTGAHLHLGIGYGIQEGTGPTGGSGLNFNAVAYLQQVWQSVYGATGTR